jgi:hypothetical protein
MSPENEKANYDLHVLSRALGLHFERQDWGIINADAGRTKEFIYFYEAHPDLSPTQKFELGELIIASANEILCSHGLIDEQLLHFLTKNGHSFKSHVEYWKNLKDISQFPIGEWLRKYISEPTSQP